MTEKSKSPAKKLFKYVGIGLLVVILYFTRSMWPLIFVGEPIATINATIPPDKQLRVGIGLQSSTCKFVTASSGRLIDSKRGWNKNYSPDKNGKVTVNIYPNTLSLCSWDMTGFSISIKNNAVPSYLSDITFIPIDVNEKIVKEYRHYDFSESYAKATFRRVNQSLQQAPADKISVTYEMAPYVSTVKNKLGEIIHLFNYSSTNIEGNGNYEIDFKNYFIINYIVLENINNVVYEEVDRVNKTKFETTAENGRKEMDYP